MGYLKKKKKERLLLYFFNRFLYRRALMSFQHDLVSALSLNQENYWMAVGEGSLVECKNKFQRKRWSKTGK